MPDIDETLLRRLPLSDVRINDALAAGAFDRLDDVVVCALRKRLSVYQLARTGDSAKSIGMYSDIWFPFDMRRVYRPLADKSVVRAEVPIGTLVAIGVLPAANTELPGVGAITAWLIPDTFGLNHLAEKAAPSRTEPAPAKPKRVPMSWRVNRLAAKAGAAATPTEFAAPVLPAGIDRSVLGPLVDRNDAQGAVREVLFLAQEKNAVAYRTLKRCSIYQVDRGGGTYSEFWLPFDPAYVYPHLASVARIKADIPPVTLVVVGSAETSEHGMPGVGEVTGWWPFDLYTVPQKTPKVAAPTPVAVPRRGRPPMSWKLVTLG